MLKKVVVGIIAILMATSAVVITLPGTEAVPQIPCNFSGYVNNGTGPVGVEIVGEIDGVAYGSTTSFDYEGDTVYALDVLGEDTETDYKDGGDDGDTVFFKVDGYFANEVGTWYSGEVFVLNLTYTVIGQPANLVINELMIDPTMDWNDDGNVSDDDEWIEIWNNGNESVELSDYYLEDNDGASTQLFGSVEPNSGIIFYGSDFDLSLGNAGDEVKLVWNSSSEIANGSMVVIDRVEYGNPGSGPDDTILSNAPLPPSGASISLFPDGDDNDDPANDFIIVYYNLPDLTVTGLTWTPEQPMEGIEVTFNATIENVGSANASAFYTSLFIDTVEEDSAWVDVLEANGTMSITLQWTAVEGNHSIQIYVDSYYNVSESNETNNAWDDMVEVLSGPTDPFIVYGNVWEFDGVDYTPLPDVLVTIEDLNTGEYIETYTDNDGKYNEELWKYYDGDTVIVTAYYGDDIVTENFTLNVSEGGKEVNLIFEVVAEQFIFNLKVGWNLISLPLIPSPAYTAESLADAIGNVCKFIVERDGSVYNSYIVGFSGSDENFLIEPDFGYYVYVTEDVNFTISGDEGGQRSVLLSEGWNLIGWTSLNNTYYASDFPALLTNSSAFGYLVMRDINTGEYHAYIPDIPSTDFQILPGQGYFIYVTDDTTLVYG